MLNEFLAMQKMYKFHIQKSGADAHLPSHAICFGDAHLHDLLSKSHAGASVAMADGA